VDTVNSFDCGHRPPFIPFRTDNCWRGCLHDRESRFWIRRKFSDPNPHDLCRTIVGEDEFTTQADSSFNDEVKILLLFPMDRAQWFNIVMGNSVELNEQTIDGIAERVPMPVALQELLSLNLAVSE